MEPVATKTSVSVCTSVSYFNCCGAGCIPNGCYFHPWLTSQDSWSDRMTICLTGGRPSRPINRSVGWWRGVAVVSDVYTAALQSYFRRSSAVRAVFYFERTPTSFGSRVHCFCDRAGAALALAAKNARARYSGRAAAGFVELALSAVRTDGVLWQNLFAVPSLSLRNTKSICWAAIFGHVPVVWPIELRSVRAWFACLLIFLSAPRFI